MLKGAAPVGANDNKSGILTFQSNWYNTRQWEMWSTIYSPMWELAQIWSIIYSPNVRTGSNVVHHLKSHVKLASENWLDTAHYL